MNRRRLLCLPLALLFAACAHAEQLRVMTFNVRLPTQVDGDNYWENRKEIAAAAVLSRDPDLFGTQELFKLQGDYLVEQLPEYEWFGISREGNQEGEYMGVFYKASKLRLIESGNFWLSETPEVPGSIAWNMNYKRMVTWAIFEIIGSGQRFRYFNTHFAHRSEDDEARMQSAKVIMSRLPDDLPFLMTGDFNTTPDSEVHALFATRLKDAWDTAGVRFGPAQTVHGFTGKASRRIDWILYNAPWSVRSAETVDDNQDGRYPSDHFPVSAVFETQ